MLGAIIGDIVGSVYELHPIKTTDFPLFHQNSRFTDDSVLTIAIADAILEQTGYAQALKTYGRNYPDAGYGGAFYNWIFDPKSAPYSSWGNGAAMRVSPVGFALSSVDRVLQEAENTAAVSHNHPEGIKGAQAVALAVFLARTGWDKDSIREEIMRRFGYRLERTVDEIRPSYRFNVSCQGTVPEAIIAFLDSEDYEDAIRQAISLGGDSDTLACIAGGIAHAYFREIPMWIVREARSRLPEALLRTIDSFEARYPL